jgi:hypothetical protein
MFYVQVKDGIVINRTVFDDYMPADWPEHDTWYQNDIAQIGWLYDGTEFTPPPPPPTSPTFNPEYDMGPSIAEILGTAPKLGE